MGKMYSTVSSNCIIALKGECHEFFTLIFHNSNPSGPLINSLKYFRNRFSFRGEIRTQNDLRDVHPIPTAEMISLRCAHTAEMISVHITETISAVCIVQHTAEIKCTPRKQNLILHLSMVAF